MSVCKKRNLRTKFSTVILAAGKGKRMYSKTPKVLHKILGKPIISFVIDLARDIKSSEIIIVIGRGANQIKQSIGKNVKYALQPELLGSGDAARKGMDISFHQNVLILCGDVPLIQKDTLMQLMDYHYKKNADFTILTCEVKDPFGYGRIIRNKKNKILGIIEQVDATIKQQRIKEINAGIYYGKKKLIISALDKITAKNHQGEYYITDVVGKMISKKKKVVGLKIYNEKEIIGINSKLDLAKVRNIVKTKWFEQLMSKGVLIEDPATVNIDLSVRIGKNVHIRPYTIIEGNTEINDAATLGPFEWIKNGKKIKTAIGERSPKWLPVD